MTTNFQISSLNLWNLIQYRSQSVRKTFKTQKTHKMLQIKSAKTRKSLLIKIHTNPADIKNNVQKAIDYRSTGHQESLLPHNYSPRAMADLQACSDTADSRMVARNDQGPATKTNNSCQKMNRPPV